MTGSTQECSPASRIKLKMRGKTIYELGLDKTLKSPEGLSVIACLHINVKTNHKQDMLFQSSLNQPFQAAQPELVHVDTVGGQHPQ